MTLQGKFDLFRQRIEPTENERQNVIGSHTHLRDNILNRLDYVKTTFLTGSYKKRTIIRPMNDVDVFVVLNHDLNAFSTPSPQIILNKLKRDLSVKYPNSSIRQDKPCIVLDFNHCKFELTPVVEGNSWNGRCYKIPNPSNMYEWKIVEDPEFFARQLSASNAQNPLLIPLIKMMKRCKQINKLKSPFSFQMERLAINQSGSFRSYREGVIQLLGDYNWMDYSRLRTLQNLSEDDFALYCRNHLFGNDFPVD